MDAFTSEPFKGNPAGVCILEKPAEEGWMQSVAKEMNLSETAFLCAQEEGFALRWFTPAVEVDLCGHATLASAHVLWESAVLDPLRPARFHTRSGPLTAEQKGGWIQLDFPAKPERAAEAPQGLSEALGVVPAYVGKNQFDYLVEVESEERVRDLTPDFTMLKTLPMRGVTVTSSASEEGYDFVSRFFAPAVGVNEDPVTGSAHCCLGPFWAQRFGKDTLVGHQISARGGTVRVRVSGERVHLGGQAVTVFRGTLVV